MDPYGFIGKYQALSGERKNIQTLAREVYDLLWTKPTLKTLLAESLVTRFETSESFSQANTLMKHLNKIDNAPPHLAERLDKASENNLQVSGAYDVKMELPKLIRRLRGTSEHSGGVDDDTIPF